MTSILPTTTTAASPERVGRAAAPAAATATQADGFAALVDGAAPAADAPDAVAFHQHSRSGVLDPVARFESFVLGTFVETMLPKDDNGLFGGGTAGNMWRSMLAERIGEELARSGGVGIADMIRERKIPSTGG